MSACSCKMLMVNGVDVGVDIDNVNVVGDGDELL